MECAHTSSPHLVHLIGGFAEYFNDERKTALAKELQRDVGDHVDAFAYPITAVADVIRETVRIAWRGGIAWPLLLFAVRSGGGACVVLYLCARSHFPQSGAIATCLP